MGSPCKVLVVDDEPLLRTLVLRNFEERIESQELEFYFANNGVEALEILEKEKDIGIVITDIKMPEMNGLDLLKHLASQDRVYRSAVVTAYGDMKNIREAMSLGVSDFITKPFDFRDLDQTLSKIIKQYNEYLNANKEKLAAVSLKKEALIAQEIQEMLSPKDFNPIPFYSDIVEIFGKIYPAEQMTGSFIDFLPIDDDKLVLFVGDSSGKGIPASLFMAMSTTLIRGFITSNRGLADSLQHVNKILCHHNKSNMSVTVFLAALDIIQGEILFCNAGFTPPFIISNDGTVKTVEGTVENTLGIEETTYHESRLKLEKNDTIIFYTKSVIEAQNKNNEIFGEERLKNYLTRVAYEPLNKIIYDLKDEIDKFSNGCPQSGDIAFFLMRYHGNT